MRFPRKRGATSVKVRVFIPDNSATNGAGLSTLTYTSTNLAISYSRENDNGATEVTGANILDISTIGTWADPGAGKLRFKAVDSAKLAGLYEIHFPDAAAFGTADTSQNIIVNVYEKTTTALKIGPNMVMIPLSSRNVLDGESDLVSILGTALTETAGYLAAGFKKLFNVAIPTATLDNLPPSSDVTAIKNKTDNLPTNPASYEDVAAAQMAIVGEIGDLVIPTAAQIDTQLSGTHGAGAWGGASGSGAILTPIEITVSGLPRDGVEVWITTDSAGNNIVASGITNALGIVVFMLDAGDYYVWKQLAGVNFVNPEDLTVS